MTVPEFKTRYGVIDTKHYGKVTVISDPGLKDGQVLIGYKGQSVYDAGYFYCPYIPLQMGGYIDTRTITRRERGCPSYPFMCTGECQKQFEGLPTGWRRELDIAKQVNSIEIVKDNG